MSSSSFGSGAAMASDQRRRALTWGAATRTCAGEAEIGDVFVVARNRGGTLLAAIDGAGHGVEAARAANTAAAIVGGYVDRDLPRLLVRCHEALRRTRGAAVSIAFLPDGGSLMTWLGIGNVEARVFGGNRANAQPRGALRLASGVLGHGLPAVTPQTLELHRGDVLVFTTDGIHPSFLETLRLSGSAQQIAERLVHDHSKPNDDGLVLVVRYLG